MQFRIISHPQNIRIVSTCLNPVWCWSSVCPHRAIVNLLQPASTQCGVGPVCVPHRAIVNLLQPASTQCGVGPVCVPHRDIVNLSLAFIVCQVEYFNFNNVNIGVCVRACMCVCGWKYSTNHELIYNMFLCMLTRVQSWLL